MSDELDRLLKESLKAAGDGYERVQDPRRRAEARAEFLSRSEKRRRTFPFKVFGAVAAGAAAVIAVVTFVVIETTGDGIPTIRDDKIGPAEDIPAVVRIPVDGEPVDMGVRDNAAWIADVGSGRVLRMDPSSGDITDELTVGESPQALAIGAGSVWVGDPVAGELYRVDKTTTEILSGPIDVGDPAPSMSISVGTSGVWVVAGGELRRVDQTTGEVTVIETAPRPLDAAANLGTVWVLDGELGLMRLDPETGESLGEPIGIDGATGDVYAGAGGIWVADRQDDTIISIDPETGQLRIREQVRGTYLDLAFGADAVWVLSRAEGTDGYLTPLDPITGDALDDPVELAGNPIQVATGAGAVWLPLRDDGAVARVDPVTLFEDGEASP